MSEIQTERSMPDRAEQAMPRGYRSPILAALATLATIGAVTAGVALAPSADAATIPIRATIEAPQPDPVRPVAPRHRTVRHASRFGVGTFYDACNGNLFIAAPVYVWVPGRGWRPQSGALVYVEELTLFDGWVRVATLRSSWSGVASGVVDVGTDVVTVRVRRPSDARTVGVTGRTHTFIMNPEPCDII